MTAQPMYFFARLLGKRPTWPDDMTPDEENIMREHFIYLRQLTRLRKVLLAGPVMQPTFGLVVLRVESEAEARQLVANDPSVLNGLHTFELQPMVASLLVDHLPHDRYVRERSEAVLRKEITVPASLQSLWHAWTTNEGAQKFFCPRTNIDLRVGGPYEILFGADAPEGFKGSDRCRVLSFVPNEMLSFEWNAPPDFRELRYQHTIVVICFEAINENSTSLRFSQSGWGKGAEWERLYAYFDAAWSYVLQNLCDSFAKS